MFCPIFSHVNNRGQIVGAVSGFCLREDCNYFQAHLKDDDCTYPKRGEIEKALGKLQPVQSKTRIFPKLKRYKPSKLAGLKRYKKKKSMSYTATLILRILKYGPKFNVNGRAYEKIQVDVTISF
jgi:hypothetical protein